MAVKKKIIIIIDVRGCFACQAYIESATVLSDEGKKHFCEKNVGMTIARQEGAYIES